MKKRRAAVLILLGLLVAAAALLLFGLFPQEPLRGYLERRLQSALGPGSRIRRMRVVPGRLRAEVQDLVIEGPTYRLEVPRGEIAFKSDLVFHKRLSLRFLRLESPRIVLHPPPGPHPETPPLSQPLIIDELVVTNGTVIYQLPPPQADVVELRGVQMRGGIGSGAVEVSATGGDWQRRPHPFPLAPAQARLRVSPLLDVSIERLEAGVANSRFAATGSLGRVGMLRPDLHVEGTLDLADVARLGAMPAAKGDVAVDGRISQVTDVLNLQATVEGRGLQVAGWPIDRAKGRVEFFPDQARTTASFTLGLLGGQAQADVNLASGAAEGHLAFSGIEAERLRAQGVALGADFQGTLGGDVSARGPLDGPLQLRGHVDANGRTADLRVKGRVVLSGRVETRPPALGLSFTADLEASPVKPAAWREVTLTAKGTAEGAFPPAVQASLDGTAVIQTASAAERVPFTGRTRIHDRAIALDLTGRALGGEVRLAGDLSGSVARRLDLSGSGLDLSRLGGGAVGKATVDLHASGPLERLTGAGSARVDGLVWQGVDVGLASVEINAVGGRANVSFAAPDLFATGEGMADLKGFHGTLQLADTPLALLQPLLAPDRPLDGRASGTVQVDLAWRHPEAAVVEARLDNVEVESGRFVAHTRAPFTLVSRNREVALSGLDIEGPGLEFQGDGRIGRGDAAFLDLHGHLAADLTRFPVPEGWTLTGRVEGQVDLGGTMSQPLATGLISLDNVTFQRPGLPLVTVADGQVQLERDVAHTTGLRATWPGGGLGIVGRVPLAAVLTDQQVDRLGLQPAPFDIEASLDLDLASLPARDGIVMKGTVYGDLDFTGTRAHPDAVGFFELSGVSVETPRATVLTLPQGRIELTGAVASTTGIEAGLAGGTLTVSGTVPLAALIAENRIDALHLTPGEADLRIAWRDVQAATLLEALRPNRPSRLVATLAGDARVTGRLTSLREMRGDLRLEPVTATVQDVEIQSDALHVVLEEARVSTDGLVLRGPAGTFRADAGLNLEDRTIEASGQGQLELRALSPLLDEASVTGYTEVDLHLSGPILNPQPTGTVVVRDGTLRVRDLRQPLTGVQARLAFDRSTVRVEDASATLGGGTVALGGSAALDGLRVTDVRLTAKGSGLGIRYPVGQAGGRARRLFEELKARVNVDLTFTGRPGDFLLGGNLVAERSIYDTDIFLEETILPPSAPPATGHAHSPFLHAIALNLTVATDNPFLVRNNLAQLEAEGSVVLRGSMDDVAPFGRFELRPGGKVFLQEREFAVDSGSLTYDGTTDPDISIQATGLMHPPEGDVEVTVVASGPLSTPKLSLSSTPSFSESELVSLVATGRTTAVANETRWIVGEQAAGLLAGRFTRQISRELMDLGFDQVDIQPELLAREGSPSARFTFGKQLTPQLRLIYSGSLSDPEAQYYQAVVRLHPGRTISLKAQRNPDTGYTFSVGQQFRFGARGHPTELREYPPTVLREVRFEGGLREFRELASVAHAAPGKKVAYWDLLDDADRIRDHLVGQGFLEAVVETRLEEQVAIFSGATGARYRWRVEGMTGFPNLDAEVRRSLFEEEAVDRGRRLLLDELHRRGHLRATVEARSVREEGYQTLVFAVDPGPVLQADVTFPGAQRLSPAALLAAAGGPAQLLNSTRDAEEGIRQAYREAQHLAAKVGPTHIAEQPGQVVIVVPVEEGPAAVIRAIRFTGATRPLSELTPLVRIDTGASYDPLAASDAVLRIRDYYLKRGYPAVRVAANVAPSGPDLELVFGVNEGQAVVVGEVKVAGLRRTRESLVREQIEFKAGDPLDPRKLAELERRLRELGIFRRVVVNTDSSNPAGIRVEVEEDARMTGSYDVRFDPEQGLSGALDAELQNLLGRGFALGGRVRGGRFVREGRLSLHVPSVFGTGDLTLSVFRSDETVRIIRELPESGQPLPVVELPRSEQGLQVQQAYHHLHPWDLLYGYRFKQTTCPVQGLPPLQRNQERHLFDPCERVPSGLVDPTMPSTHIIDLAALDLAAVRDTRNSPLNPTRGSFMTFNLQAAPKLVGSDFDFLKHFVQVSFLEDLGRSLAWAHGYRLGMIQTFGGERLPYDELFHAGGPNSVRGYGVDDLGPHNGLGEPLGGEAVVIVNQELRYHHRIGLGAAVFYDGGNVFAKARDLGLSLRHSLGVGLRYDSPVGLLRIDVGFPLGRRPGESSFRWWIGLGQAF